MKKILITICTIFIAGFAHADTINIHWLNEDYTAYDTTTCTVGGNLSLPTTPTKRGYTFTGWEKLFTSIEYIESTGTQYIDTGVLATSSVRMSLMAYAPENPQQNFGWIFGVRTNAASFAGMFFPAYNSTRMRFDYLYKSDISCSATQSIAGKVLLIDINNNHKVSIQDMNGSFLCENDLPTGSFTTNVYILLFGTTTKNGGTDLAPSTKIYSVKIWENDVLVRDFIPVLDSNGVACMFDKVSGQFFYNAGTGDFIAGPEITE